MRSKEDLRRTLQRSNGRGYKAYKDIEEVYDFGEYTLFIDHVQGDPFASPSNFRVRIPQRIAGFPQELFSNKVRQTALEDFITRAFANAIRQVSCGRRGSGKSGLIGIDTPGQEVLERTTCFVGEEFLEVRFVVGLPAYGRTIKADECAEMIFEEIPRIVKQACVYKALSEDAVREHVDTCEDAEFIRGKLEERGLVAFVGDGSCLPRRSGTDDRPLSRKETVLWEGPESLQVEFHTPNHGLVRGTGIPKGVTLIVGGGYHGKSTLLRAIERGVYNHIPGDGREWVVTIPEAVKIRAEDGRRVEKVNISPFISNLPQGKDTKAFSTDNASGSTSQAANIIEALEVGAKLLLIDEDTSATNFMIRDQRMQRLVAKEKEPITPFIDRVRQLYEELGVSTILVMGGAGDYFDVADTIVMMDEYKPRDVTEEAKGIVQSMPSMRKKEVVGEFGEIIERVPLPESFDPSRGKREVKIKAQGLHTIMFGRTHIDLSLVEQLVDVSQTRAIGDLIYYALKHYINGKRTLREILELVEKDIYERGLEGCLPYLRTAYALPRRFELAGAINRMRTLRVVQKELKKAFADKE